MSYMDRIRWQFRIRRREPALALPGADQRIVTYDELDIALNNVGRRLCELAIIPGAVYALLVKDPLLQLVLAFALDELRAANMVVYDLKLPQAWPVVRVDQSWLLGDGRPLPRTEAKGSDDDICRVVLTSGSTGIPKGVFLSWGVVEERIANIDYVFGEMALHDRIMCCIVSAEHRTCLFVLSRGGVYCHPEPTIEATAKKISSLRVQSLIAAPATLGQILKAPHPDRKGFQSLKLIRTGGSQLPRALAERVRDTMCSRLFNHTVQPKQEPSRSHPPR